MLGARETSDEDTVKFRNIVQHHSLCNFRVLNGTIIQMQPLMQQLLTPNWDRKYSQITSRLSDAHYTWTLARSAGGERQQGNARVAGLLGRNFQLPRGLSRCTWHCAVAHIVSPRQHSSYSRPQHNLLTSLERPKHTRAT